MSERFLLRLIPVGPLVMLALDGMAQPRAADCFFSADFEGADALAGWDIGDSVETQTADGTPLGVRAAAWTIGDARAANADGYFPVADQPIGNRFVMANDAALPCNCGMSNVALVTPAMDLTARTGVSLECRVFNEGDLGAGAATIEGNIGGGSWIALATVPTVANQWQPLFINLSAFDGQQDVRIRFRWSDGGGWSSGFALDDVCLRERLENDLTVTSVFIGDPTVQLIDGTVQSLSYHRLPLAQFDSLLFGMEITNRGTAVATVNELAAQLLWNGELIGALTAVGPGELSPGSRATVQFASVFEPTGTGTLTVNCSIPPEVPDDGTTDNSDSTTIRFTGAGWDAGYGAMAVDDGSVEGHLGSTENFVLANRMEIMNEGSSARGISVVLSSSCTLGEEIRALLMDANLAFLDTSTRHVITEQDLENGWFGMPLYLALTEQAALAVGDHFVGIQHLKTGNEGLVEVAMGGPAQVGGSILMEGLTFDLSHIYNVPMVRLHLDDLDVGISKPSLVSTIGIFPVPTDEQMTMQFNVTSALDLQVSLFDAVGKRVFGSHLGSLPPGRNSSTIDLTGVASGVYTVVISSPDQRSVGRVEVVH
ncbi:MAG: T9SS type A sorting domain-containing protein [Flavobacteriales bacterium]|nr:T9SS type A sorting domain-containing protein [Flavobacteriales bacterium]